MNIFWHVMGSKPILVASNVAAELFNWALNQQEYVTTEEEWNKVERILSVAKRIEQRYRLAHGLPNMGV